MKAKKPSYTWINTSYLLALTLALATLALVLWHGWREENLPPGQHVADVTVNLGGVPVREHCTTCHPDGRDAQGAEHPAIVPHEPADLGCTGCHLGEGMALDLTLSHGRQGNGARRVLAGKDIQASCFRCHPVQKLEGASRAWNGYRLFLRFGCDTCHPLAGLPEAGRSAPDLSSIGDYLGIDRLLHAIREPREEPPNSTMPRYPMSRREAHDLAVFLKSRTATSYFQTPMERMIQDTSLPWPDDLFSETREGSVGLRLLWENHCLACHKLKEADGRIAPDLTFLARQRPADYLRDFPANPSRLVPDATMPAIRLTGEEALAIQKELKAAANKTGQKLLAKHPEARDLYMALCQRCHAADGNGRGPIAPNLATLPRAFAGNREFFRAKPDEELQRSLRDGLPGTSMPPYGGLLDEPSRNALIDLLFRAFIGGERLDKAPWPELPPQPAAPPPPTLGNNLFAEHCARCHGRLGTGRGPDAEELSPRPRNLTNIPYFASRSDAQILRVLVAGQPGTAMPAWGKHLSAEELWALLGRVRQFAAGGPHD